MDFIAISYMHIGGMVTANAQIAQWDDLLEEGFWSYWKGNGILWALYKNREVDV